MSQETTDTLEHEKPRGTCTPASAPSRKGRGLPAHLVGKGFKKGQSGNPSGRPKDAHKLASVARSFAPNAIDIIVEIMNDPTEHGKVRLTAASILLDRGFGKSLSQKQVTLSAGEGAADFVGALREFRSRRKIDVVDGEVVEVEPGKDDETAD